MNKSNDPLGLFGSREKPSGDIGSHEKPSASAVGSGGNPTSKFDFSTLLIGGLLGIAILLVYQRIKNDGGRIDGDRQQQEQREGDSSNRQQANSSYRTLIFLHERNPQPIEHDLLLREMPKFCEANKLEFRAFDDDITDQPIPDLLAWAKGKGVEPPLVIITGKDNQPIKSAKWPAGLDELKALLK